MVLIQTNIFNFQWIARTPAFLLALQTVAWNAMLRWPSPKVPLLSSNVPKVWGVRPAKQFLWADGFDSILKGLHLHYISHFLHQRIRLSCKIWLYHFTLILKVCKGAHFTCQIASCYLKQNINKKCPIYSILEYGPISYELIWEKLHAISHK